mgnify:CR=1 FL=1
MNAKNHIPKKRAKKNDKAYFASKSELLTWVSTTLGLEIKSIEQTSTGAIFCQLLDAAHPGTVRMNKVNWKAKLETEYISNFKIFQQGLSNNNIDKPINITRLAKGKTQELIELLQWLYGHHISLGIDYTNYDAQKKRNGQNFVFHGEKGINMNKSIRDDLSQCSSITDFRDLQMKNNLKNKIKLNINNLNANLRGDKFHTKFNNQSHQELANLNSNLNKMQNKKMRGKSEMNSMTKRSNHSLTLSSSSGNDKNNDDSYNKNSKFDNKYSSINDISSSPFIIDEQPEEDEKLNNILFDGINNVDKDNILDLEKTDGNNVHDLKILIRKLRVNNIIFKTNLGTILNKVTKERDFYLNKLKDIEYLYFNPIIKNSNDNKNSLLKSILTCETDSTIMINNDGIAMIKEKENCGVSNYSLSNKSFPIEEKKEKDQIDFKDIKNEINENNQKEYIKNDDRQIRRNSQKVVCIKLIYSKENKNDQSHQSNIEEKTKINKTQPIVNCIKNEKSINGINSTFSMASHIFQTNKRNCIQRENNDTNINNNIHVTPTSKTCLYDISSHILNDSLHIPNTENANPNINNFNLE